MFYKELETKLAFERREKLTMAMAKTERELFLYSENENLKKQIEELKAKYCDELQKRLALAEQIKRIEEGGAE